MVEGTRTECKGKVCFVQAHAERMSSLVGKYESNATALTLALSYSDQALEACQGLISLLDSEISVLLANCRAAGIGGFGTYTLLSLLSSLHSSSSDALVLYSGTFLSFLQTCEKNRFSRGGSLKYVCKFAEVM